MKRKIINISEEKCNGCGVCIPNCPEGALQIIDGRARLISDLFCDGLGACIGTCPQDAITTEEREAQPYDENKVMENIVKQGENVIKAHLKHLKEHNEIEYLNQAINYMKKNNIKVPNLENETAVGCAINEKSQNTGCPGSRILDFREEKNDSNTAAEKDIFLKSELKQWPIQIQLLNPNASYFKNAELLITADCVPFTFANFHQRFLKNKVLIVFCPKLDKTIEQYIEKLTQIFKTQDIKSITIVHMEVPCCFGVENVVQEALKRAEKDIIIKEYTISLKGEII